MEGIPEVLQLAIIVQRSGLSCSKPQTFQKFKLLVRYVSAESGIIHKFLKTARHLEEWIGFFFYKLEAFEDACPSIGGSE